LLVSLAIYVKKLDRVSISVCKAGTSRSPGSARVRCRADANALESFSGGFANASLNLFCWKSQDRRSNRTKPNLESLDLLHGRRSHDFEVVELLCGDSLQPESVVIDNARRPVWDRPALVQRGSRFSFVVNFLPPVLRRVIVKILRRERRKPFQRRASSPLNDIAATAANAPKAVPRFSAVDDE